MRRLGVLLPYAENDAEAKSHLSALTQETQTAGVVQDRNIRIDIRYAANCALAPSALSGSEATVYLPLEIDIGECLPIGIAAFVSSATQGGGKAGVAGINSFGQGLLERGECVFKCVAEGPAPPIGKRHEALNHLGRRLDV